MDQIIELPVIEEPLLTYDQIEARLARFFREQIYLPLIRELGFSSKTLQNAKHPNPLVDALFTGRIVYTGGRFIGKLSAQISKELKDLGAQYDSKSGSYKLPESKIPPEVKQAIAASYSRFKEKMEKIDEKLAKLDIDEVPFQIADLFDQALWKADRSFHKNVEKITITPELTAEQRKRIADLWQNNMKLDIKGWTQEQIKKLRGRIYEDVMSGQRREALIPPILKITKTIQGSYEEALNKAKFLARQETRLLMTTFKESRYIDAGAHEYIWRCVHRPHDKTPDQHIKGNVRYAHGLLNGKIFRFDSPPITTNPGQAVRRNNPGQDYNCRCFARPIMRIRKS